jgi:curved DNA-binding protein CbpA
MAQCGCGRPLGASGKLCARCDALKTLGLERGASRNEIRDAYRVMVKVWHPDRFSNDGKLRSKAEEKLKEVNAAFQRLNSSADTTPARAASATKKPEEKAEAQKPYETSKTSTRTSEWYSASANQWYPASANWWYSASARKTPRPNASAQEPPRKDVSAPGFPNAARPQSNGNARTQSPAPEGNRPINAAFQHLNSSADTTAAREASATKKPEEKAEAQKPYETAKTSTRTSQWSSVSARETPRSNATAQEPPRKYASASGFPNAARPQSSGDARPQSPTLVANRPINKGAPSALFSLRGISYLLALALFVAFTRMWVDAGKNPNTAQDEIMNQYYEAEARKNAFSQPTAQDVIMNLYYEVETRENALSQLQSAPTKAENSVVAPSSFPASPKQDLHLPQKRSSTTAVSDPLRSDARLPVPGTTAQRNHVACRERGGRLNHHGDCRTR